MPAYNEEERLPHMLGTHIEYILKQQKAGKVPKAVEIVVIDDGSRDKTWEIIQKWEKKHSNPKSGVVVRGLR